MPYIAMPYTRRKDRCQLRTTDVLAINDGEMKAIRKTGTREEVGQLATHVLHGGPTNSVGAALLRREL